MNWSAALHLRPVFAAGLLIAACAPAPSPPPPLPPVPPAPPAAEIPVPPPPCVSVTRIEVIKSRRLLRAHCEGGRIVELTVALGRDTAGAKLRAGDTRTPEGHYRVNGPPRSSRFHLFIPIDYPSLEDARAGRADGRISAAAYARIEAAHARGESPPGDTALGGNLGFHGEGDRWRGDSVDLDWTNGCVGLSDADIDFLAARIAVGTPVAITP
jgi:hypothetical protein